MYQMVALCIKQLMNTKLTDMFRRTRRWSMSKINQIGAVVFQDVGSRM